ncbi:MAG: transposase [Sulfolobales archaeon]
MRGNQYKILSYKIKHNYEVKDFLVEYKRVLQRAIDIIWNNIKWIEREKKNYYYIVKNDGKLVKKYYKVKRLIPKILRSSSFKRKLREELLRNWGYAAHYIDSAIKTAYSIINSWRKNYLKGLRRRSKPTIKREFVRIKETLYRVKDSKVVVTIKPQKIYLEFDLSKAWFRRRVKGLEMGELILKEKELIITYRKNAESQKPQLRIGWDINIHTLDGFSPKLGWIRISLAELHHIHRVYEIKRARAQSIASKKPSIKNIVSKYGSREKNRSRDFVHKLTTDLARMFPHTIHGFEDLEKQGMYSNFKKHNREISKQNWKQIIRNMSYKSNIKLVDPRGTSSTCPMCGDRVIKLRKGQVVKCPRCNLILDRQLCGAINIYLRMCGFPQEPSTFYRAVIRKMIPLWKERMRLLGRVTANGGEGCDKPPRNPGGGGSLMIPKGLGLISCDISHYETQTPSPVITF